MSSSVSSCAHTAVASADDEDVGVHGLGDGSLVDVRLLAQPIVFVTGGQLDGGHSSFALGLSVTALGSFMTASEVMVEPETPSISAEPAAISCSRSWSAAAAP